MLKILGLAIAAFIIWRLLRGKLALLQGASMTIEHARAVLNLPVDASREQIIAAHRELMARIHPDRSPSGIGQHQAKEANAARDVLLKAIERQKNIR